uniref:3'5' cyclic nucleotide phosphodiesterase n=1 Tax=Acytostelium subglobosum TaxID=361139 RepID=H6V7L1_ACYSU|nr:3'5' cyclic nucleotide phosphodiesterase [Acytostelium subglobosum]
MNYNDLGNYIACKRSSFITIPLGTGGGLDESNLSAFLFTKRGSSVFIAFDAGTLWTGAQSFLRDTNYATYFNITFPPWATQIDQQVAWFIRNHVLGYVIGHPHMDHIQGMVQASPEDYLPSNALDMKIDNGLIGLLKDLLNPILGTSILTKKAIVGLPFTINSIQNHIFNNVLWPNLPGFGRYDYFTMIEGRGYNLTDVIFLNDTQRQSLVNTFPNNAQLTAYSTCHNDIQSTAFIYNDQITAEQVVFFSDTGIPSGNYNCDYQQKIYNVWKNVRIDKLKAIFLECSYPNNQSESQLFGHLRPKDIMPLLVSLLDLGVQPTPRMKSLSHVKLIVQHIKPLVNQTPSANKRLNIRQIIYKELTDYNPVGIQVNIPTQGEPICI